MRSVEETFRVAVRGHLAEKQSIPWGHARIEKTPGSYEEQRRVEV
jgi:hypothetical protein